MTDGGLFVFYEFVMWETGKFTYLLLASIYRIMTELKSWIIDT